MQGLGSIPQLLSQIQTQDWRLGQPPLFELNDLPDQDEWSLAQRVSSQQAILGARIDAHPLELAAIQLAEMDTVSTLESVGRLGDEIRVAGIRQTVQRFHTKDEGSYYILELDDALGILAIKMTPVFYRYHLRWLSSQAPFLVEGRMEILSTTKLPVLIAKKLWPISSAQTG